MGDISRSEMRRKAIMRGEEPPTFHAKYSDQTVERMVTMLRSLEWGRDDSRESDHSFCPWCANTGREGHETDCELDALLSELEGPLKTGWRGDREG